jgi:hypothetical protein
VNVLTIGIAHEDMHENMAVPITWNVSATDGSSAADGQIQVLERFLQVIDPSDIDVTVADREFISVAWLQALREREIPFAGRLRSDRWIGDAPGGPPPRKAHGWRERSLFRYRLDRLQSILTTPEPQHQASFDCLQGLRSPSAFSSCT